MSTDDENSVKRNINIKMNINMKTKTMINLTYDSDRYRRRCAAHMRKATIGTGNMTLSLKKMATAVSDVPPVRSLTLAFLAFPTKKTIE